MVLRCSLCAVLFAGIGAAQTAPSAAAVRPSILSPSTEVNRILPSWLTLGGQFRVRFEGYSGGGFGSSDDAYALTQLRLSVTIRPVSWLRFFGEGMDARALEKSPALPPYANTWDIRQGYAEAGDSEKGMFGLRAGRQELNFGDQRLIGASPWTNVGRVFDAVRGTVRYKGYRLDAFASSVVNATTDTWDHHLQGNNLHGLYGGIEKLIPNATLEPYILWRLQPRVKNEAGVVANMDEKVSGVRFVGKLPHGLDYGTEMVREFGGLGTDRIHAWAGHWVMGATAKAVPGARRLFAEYNYASGDKNPKDGDRGTFDQLYPSGHDKYGLADQVGWRNIKDIRLGLETKPLPRVGVAFEYNDWSLASATDALYVTAGAALARNTAGTAGTHVGQEADVIATWTPVKPVALSAGYGHIFPGEFLKNTTAGHSYSFPYMMAIWKF